MFVDILAHNSEWKKFFLNCHNASIFHHPEWANLLERSYGYKLFWIVTREKAGNVTAGLPAMEISSPLSGRRWVSLPFTDYSAPLYTNLEDLLLILRYLINIREKQNLNSIEIRFPIPQIDGILQYDLFVFHTLKLNADPDVIFKKFRKKGVRYEIKKAKREGVEVKLCSSKKEFEIFCDLQLKTRRKLGVPVQPRKFFELFWDYLIEADMGFVLIAYKEAIPLASSVFLKYKSTVTYKYSASDPKFLKLSPNNAILWEAIKWACLNGYEVFNFGKTKLTNIGLRNFKNGWGTVEEPLPYSFIGSSPSFSSNEMLLKIAGVVIRHSPAIACRGIGKVFYKYFG